MTFGIRLRAVVIEDQVAGRFRRLLRMAGDAAKVENWFDITEVFHVLDGLLEAQSRFVLDVPFLARLIVGLRGQERRLLRQIENGVIGSGGGSLCERSRLLAVGVAAAAVGAHLAWPQLMPG